MTSRRLIGDRPPLPHYEARGSEGRDRLLLAFVMVMVWAVTSTALGLFFLAGAHTTGEGVACVFSAAILGLSIAGLVYLYGSIIYERFFE